MNKRFRTCDLNQPYLLPPSLEEWLPQNHLARFIAEVTEELDLSALYSYYERRDGRGQAAYHPMLMTRLLLYAYCTGRVSSRVIERCTWEDVAFRYLAADQHPDHDTIAAFRKQHLDALAELFAQVLELCRLAGLVKVGMVALDGTKMGANASRKRSYNYRGLEREEARLAEIVARLLEEAEQVDAAEDARYGKGKRGDELPESLAKAEGRRRKIREARAALEQEARERAAQAEKEKSANKAAQQRAGEAQRKRWQRARRPAQESPATRNLTDPDSQIMRDSRTGGFMQAYNAQAAVLENQIIVAAEVTPQPADKQQLKPMGVQLEQGLGAKPSALLADAGYWSEEAVLDTCWEGVNVLVAPDRKPGSSLTRSAPRGPAAVAMREKLRSGEGRRLYGLRKLTVEPVFGQIKAARGLSRFWLRGLENVKAEWKLICLGHNLLKLFRTGSFRPVSATA